ncbi:induced myeloid leukemia cell differentiation protein Mcl-1 [Python bivittatus]|uniref:Induced myeloid leukemia cell differentiation protein Mcl-1 n=1 Tax=Python bivittatus TaxID=176946 RepID=A0A9F2N014_PYTBI|nr:induced myeloid leukemia cell differentiation protein Mcl-1 [Python bivittatus]
MLRLPERKNAELLQPTLSGWHAEFCSGGAPVLSWRACSCPRGAGGSVPSGRLVGILGSEGGAGTGLPPARCPKPAEGRFLQGLLGRFGASPGEAKTAARGLETLRRVCDDILNKHQLVFQGILRKMEIEKADDLKIVSEVAMQVFSDGVTNWGRIVTLISFGAFVAKHLKSINQDSGISTLAEIITDVLVTDKREWLLHHNAWEGFVKFFHVEDLEGSIRNILVAFASVAGIGASLAYLIR